MKPIKLEAHEWDHWNLENYGSFDRDYPDSDDLVGLIHRFFMMGPDDSQALMRSIAMYLLSCGKLLMRCPFVTIGKDGKSFYVINIHAELSGDKNFADTIIFDRTSRSTKSLKHHKSADDFLVALQSL